MILNFSELSADDQLSADVCIVGAGAAGLTIAREFAKSSYDVIVVESGGLAVSEDVEELNDGDVVGRSYLGLRGGRRRGLGGTTAAWGGQCCEFDSIDFFERSWVPDSGWPIDKEQLLPYYRRAEHMFGVHGRRYDDSNWSRFGIDPVRFDDTKLQTSFSVFSPRPRLGKVYRSYFAKISNVRFLLGATATTVITNDAASAALGVTVKDYNGKAARIGARVTIICTGTIESARLLLCSRDVATHGLGNQYDQVGRYLLDHPTSDTATVVSDTMPTLQEIYGILYRGRTWYWPKIGLAGEQQRALQVLNGSASVMFEYHSPALEVLRNMVRTTRTGGRFTFSAARIAALVRGAPTVVDAGFRRYILGRSPRAKPSKVDLTCTIEQSPNAESRVALSATRDRLGMQRAAISWRITDAELRTFRAITETVQAEFARLNLGTVLPHKWLQSEDQSDWIFWDNYHQTGTTRMSLNPRAGVVDANCQVHGVAGLFVAGAPTFPTSGYANPVLTIAAMSIRLSDYVKYSVLRRKTDARANLSREKN